MKKAAVASIRVAVVLLALGVTAEAQQPKKVNPWSPRAVTPASHILPEINSLKHAAKA